MIYTTKNSGLFGYIVTIALRQNVTKCYGAINEKKQLAIKFIRNLKKSF
jgi:hypothetical protein